MDKRFRIMYDTRNNSWCVYEDLTPSHKDQSDPRYYHIWIEGILTSDAADKIAEFLGENSGSLKRFNRDRP